MSALDSVRAQDGAVRALQRARQHGRVASAYLFDGPSGVGKERAAVAFATDVVSGGNPHIVDRIEAEAHPDVRVFGPRDEGKRNIQVEVLRNEILPLAQFAPFEASSTFFIFPEADVSFPAFQAEAANALLKTLEEPRPNVHFILTSERPDSLLPTIRSRCQRIRFARLPDAVLRDILQSEGVPEESIAPATIEKSSNRRSPRDSSDVPATKSLGSSGDCANNESTGHSGVAGHWSQLMPTPTNVKPWASQSASVSSEQVN